MNCPIDFKVVEITVLKLKISFLYFKSFQNFKPIKLYLFVHTCLKKKKLLVAPKLMNWMSPTKQNIHKILSNMFINIFEL
jgi:hypothetical protein